VIPGATVLLVNQDNGVARETVSNDVGEYSFPGVVPGVYTVRASVQGFKTFERKDARIGTQQFLTLDIVLEVGAVEETITVAAEAPLIETSNASTGEVLDKQTLETLPSICRRSRQQRRDRHGNPHDADRGVAHLPAAASRSATTTCRRLSDYRPAEPITEHRDGGRRTVRTTTEIAGPAAAYSTPALGREALHDGVYLSRPGALISENFFFATPGQPIRSFRNAGAMAATQDPLRRGVSRRPDAERQPPRADGGGAGRRFLGADRFSGTADRYL
jgi:hypothetical protein